MQQYECGMPDVEEERLLFSNFWRFENVGGGMIPVCENIFDDCI
jgi:hypothetical protein